MTALAKRLAGTLSAGELRQSDHAEASVDRVAALGMASRLGACLVRIASGSSAGDTRTALLILAKRLMRDQRVPVGMARRMAAAAMFEWQNAQCQACGGTGFRARDANGVRALCQPCDGSGVHRFSDTERRRALGLDANKPMPRMVQQHYDKVVDQCQTAYQNAMRTVKRKLGD